MRHRCLGKTFNNGCCHLLKIKILIINIKKKLMMMFFVVVLLLLLWGGVVNIIM